MGIYDTIMLLILGAAAFLGWRKGMISQVAAIVSLVLSFFVATNFYEQVAVSISAPDPWNRVAAFVITYLGTSFVVWFFFRQIRNSVKAMQLGEFDRQMGALLGAGKGLAIVTIITLVAVNLLTAESGRAIAESRAGLVVSRAVHVLGPIMPARIQGFLAEYVQRLDAMMGVPAPQDPYGYQVEGGYPGGYPAQNPGYPNTYPQPPAGAASGQEIYPSDPSFQRPNSGTNPGGGYPTGGPPPPYDWRTTTTDQGVPR